MALWRLADDEYDSDAITVASPTAPKRPKCSTTVTQSPPLSKSLRKAQSEAQSKRKRTAVDVDDDSGSDLGTSTLPLASIRTSTRIGNGRPSCKSDTTPTTGTSLCPKHRRILRLTSPSPDKDPSFFPPLDGSIRESIETNVAIDESSRTVRKRKRREVVSEPEEITFRLDISENESLRTQVPGLYRHKMPSHRPLPIANRNPSSLNTSPFLWTSPWIDPDHAPSTHPRLILRPLWPAEPGVLRPGPVKYFTDWSGSKDDNNTVPRGILPNRSQLYPEQAAFHEKYGDGVPEFVWGKEEDDGDEEYN